MSPRKKIHHHVFRFGWLAFAGLVIGIALLVSIARMLLPLLEDYRTDIEQLATQQLGRVVHIGRVSAGWKGLHPQLSFSDVSVFDADGKRVWLHLKKVQASIDVTNSLLSGRFEISHVNFEGLKLDFERHRDGTYSVSGVRTGAGEMAGHGGRRLLAWLATCERISILESDITWKDPRLSSRPIHLDKVDLRLEQSAPDYRVSGSASLASQKGRQLFFVLDLSGDPARPGALKGRFYLEGSLRLGPWLNGEILSHTAIKGGEFAFKLWGEGGSRMERLSGDVAFHHLRWTRLQHAAGARGQSVARPFALDTLGGRLFWRRTGHGWTLDLERLNVARGGKVWPQSDAHVAYTRAEDGVGRSVAGRIGFVRLQDVNAFLLALSGPDKRARAALARLQPRGDIRDLGFSVHRDANAADRFFVRARFQGLGLNRWDKLPGITGLNGNLVLDQDRGFVDLHSRDAGLDYARLFAAPLRADLLNGRIYWSRSANRWRVVARGLEVENSDIQGRGRFSLDIPVSGASPFLDMQLAFRNGDVGHVRRYLPRKIMSPDVVAWLDHALSAGRVTSGRMLYFGRLADFPFDHHQGIFEARFGVEDMLFDYQPGWARAEDVTAEVSFRNRSLNTRIAYGKILGMDVQPSSVTIGDLSKKAVLRLRGGLHGSLQDMLRYLAESPIAAEQRDFLGEVKGGGQGKLTLDLELPLARAKDGRVSGAVQFENGSLKLPAWDVGLSSLKGALGFASDRSGLRFSAKDLKARFRNKPARVDVATHTSPMARTTRIDIRSHMDAAALLGRRTAFLKQYLKGKSDWLISASVQQPTDRKRSTSVGIHLESALQGVKVTLPGVLHKSAGQPRTLVVGAEFAAQGLGPVTVRYGKLVRAKFLLKGSALDRGELRFGGGAAVLPQSKGLYIAGSLPKVSVSAWRKWSASAGRADRYASLLGSVMGIDVSLDELELYGHRFHRVELKAKNNGRRWTANVNSRELAGKLLVPDDPVTGGAAVMDLSYLHLTVPNVKHTGAALDPRLLPALKISAKALTYNGISLGGLTLVARRMAGGLNFEQMDMESPYFKVKATGSWTLGEAGQVSEFKITASTDNLGDVLDRLGYQGGIEGGRAVGEINANWHGPPSWFELSRLNGTVHLVILKGRLLGVDPGRGRVFGLLSLQTLPRRLSLDFSDLFARGFSFDRIAGDFSIADGDAYTNDLYMYGPAARVDVSGRVGLATRDYDQNVLVTPRVTSSIPLIGGLAGGPGVGLGLWVAERVFGKKIDELSRSRYTITGSWEDPKVEPFGEGKP